MQVTLAKSLIYVTTPEKCIRVLICIYCPYYWRKVFRQFRSGDAVDRIQVQNINTAVKTNIGLIYATCRSVSCEGMGHDVNMNVPYDDGVLSLSLFLFCCVVSDWSKMQSAPQRNVYRTRNLSETSENDISKVLRSACKAVNNCALAVSCLTIQKQYAAMDVIGVVGCIFCIFFLLVWVIKKIDAPAMKNRVAFRTSLVQNEYLSNDLIWF